MEHPKSTSARKAVQAIGDAAAGGAQSIDRAATLLLLVGRAGPFGARLSELVEQCDLAKPTVRRMLLALVRAGLLDQDPETRRYYIGPEIYVLGTLASARFGIHPISLRSLVRLSQETGDTAFLSVPRDVYSICVHREEGPYPIRIHALHAGDRHPLGVGAGSLALLSALPDHEVEEVMTANADSPGGQAIPSIRPCPPYTGSGDPGQGLRTESGNAASRLVGRRRRHPRASDGRPIGALSIAAIESRLGKERQKEMASLLKKEASSIETRLREVGSSERHMRRKDHMQRKDQ